ncbi:COG4223 family protein [Labrenzia sp. PHM005]|uniref:COG4223 family protein n=1 Tax=Labrenzia sp. PHM005 TaxID=2590016 RepID=UPI001AD8A993|nr:mitofilin family membrane protein [Labrenzia sp. PHM005]
MIAAVIGGVLVLGGGFGLYQAGLIKLTPEPDQQMTRALTAAQKKITELESQLSDFGTKLSGQDSSSAVSALENKLAGLEEKVADAANAGGSDAAAAVDALKKDVEALKSDLSSISTGTGEGAPVNLQPLQDRLASVEESIKSASSVDLGPIETRLSDLEGGSSAAASEAGKISGSVTALEGDVKSIETKLTELQTRLQNTEATAKAAQTAVSTSDVSLKTLADSQARATETLSSLSSDIQSVGAANTAALEDVRAELDALSKRLAQVESTMGDATARETAARALSVSALKSAVDSGRPYETELAAVKAGLPAGMDISALESHAKTGVEPVSVLIAQFPNVARSVYQTFSEPEESGDVLESFLASARSLVAVRGPGNTDGTGPDAVLRRMENAVSKGDLSAAIAASKELPDAGQKAAADWTARAQARVEVDALTEKASQEVLNALSGKS